MTYFHKIAKNGKNQYFRVDADGKKKMVKRKEYEANVAQEVAAVETTESNEIIEAVKDETDPAVTLTFCEMHKPSGCHECPNRHICEKCANEFQETAVAKTTEIVAPLDFVQSIVGETIGKYKLTFKDWKTYASVYYRSAAICGFVFDEKKNITAVKFMGTAHETRKTITEIKIESQSDLDKIKDFILRQIEFVNWWWNNPTIKTGGVPC